ncbi:MAG: hypothetical protein E6H78_11905 [Betaproteobacteria bacterium]|jgi:hypothetical protein|nr:MAG: hypothetical protein E6H78_11905 [Betaproteobacteria bacterium]
MRRCRKRIAGWVMLGWLFAQIVTVVHACPALTATTQDSTSTAASAAGAATSPSDCAAMAKQAGSNANVCQSHCIAGQQIGSDAQTPCAALAPRVALAVRACTVETPVAASLHASTLRATGPPPTLLFSRFLI